MTRETRRNAISHLRPENSHDGLDAASVGHPSAHPGFKHDRGGVTVARETQDGPEGVDMFDIDGESLTTTGGTRMLRKRCAQRF